MDILNIRLLEIGVLDFAHDTAPALLRIEQIAVRVDIGTIKVVGTTLARIEREVQGLDNRRLTIVEFATREHLAESDLTGIRIRQRVKVVFDISRRI